MTLPNDVSRCHDGQCGGRYQCQRWVDRDVGGTRVVHCATIKDGWVPHHRPCDGYIGEPIPDEDEE